MVALFATEYICSVLILYNSISLFGAGNFMYFAANSKYMIMGSRFIVGEFISETLLLLEYSLLLLSYQV